MCVCRAHPSRRWRVPSHSRKLPRPPALCPSRDLHRPRVRGRWGPCAARRAPLRARRAHPCAPGDRGAGEVCVRTVCLMSLTCCVPLPRRLRVQSCRRCSKSIKSVSRKRGGESSGPARRRAADSVRAARVRVGPTYLTQSVCVRARARVRRPRGTRKGAAALDADRRRIGSRVRVGRGGVD